ncbi:Rha family transcriptional regulator [Lactiplantibacillus songbeiensis]|uniref:Rha family transcriptional regulator n=1 Tax=Lactiplantibacillus songbeiensis TaxID=2559920 RepID=A0ABW4BY68_9LACO|nr:Rha family transcriptional regulator [Lactiplantibacillus songbeiensis]
MDLVVLTSQRLDAEPFTSSDIIAENIGIKRNSIKQTIQNHIARLEHFGKVPLIVEPLPSGQSTTYYRLNEQQAMMLFFYLNNTPQVEDFQERLVKQFASMKQALIERRAKFELGKEFSKGLQSAIADSPALDEHHHLYANINKLVYKNALGVNVNELRRARSIPKTDAITSYLSADEADAVRKVKSQITNLLEMKMDYQQIKQALAIQGVIYRIRLTLPANAVTPTN